MSPLAAAAEPAVRAEADCSAQAAAVPGPAASPPCGKQRAATMLFRVLCDRCALGAGALQAVSCDRDPLASEPVGGVAKTAVVVAPAMPPEEAAVLDSPAFAVPAIQAHQPAAERSIVPAGVRPPAENTAAAADPAAAAAAAAAAAPSAAPSAAANAAAATNADTELAVAATSPIACEADHRDDDESAVAEPVRPKPAQGGRWRRWACADAAVQKARSGSGAPARKARCRSLSRTRSAALSGERTATGSPGTCCASEVDAGRRCSQHRPQTQGRKGHKRARKASLGRGLRRKRFALLTSERCSERSASARCKYANASRHPGRHARTTRTADSGGRQYARISSDHHLRPSRLTLNPRATGSDRGRGHQRRSPCGGARRSRSPSQLVAGAAVAAPLRAAGRRAKPAAQPARSAASGRRRARASARNHRGG